MELRFERLSPEELSQLAAYEQSLMLNEIIAEAAKTGKLLKGAKEELAKAKKKTLLADKQDKPQCRADQIDAQLVVDHLNDRTKTLTLVQSMIKKLLEMA